MNRIALYSHGGSANHGCEAIVRSIVTSLADEFPGERFTLVSLRREEDEKYMGPEDVFPMPLDICAENDPFRNRAIHTFLYAKRKLLGDSLSYPRYRYRMLTGEERPKAAISVGGDNYCYPSEIDSLTGTNRLFNERNIRTILAGCSLEPADLKESGKLREDMRLYAGIIARESITYEALLESGVVRERLRLMPDPAFSLKTADIPLPEWLTNEDTVGINLSPLLENYAGRQGISAEAYEHLIRSILANTDMHIALIPHVVRGTDDDTAVLKRLFTRTGENERVHIVEDAGACILKAYISKCRFFAGARTHSTIAAYSSCVPTLTVGYSVKSRGIAADLFGTDEHYVLPVQKLQEAGQLVSAFEWLMENEGSIRSHLEKIIPEVREKAGLYGRAVREICSGADCR